MWLFRRKNMKQTRNLRAGVTLIEMLVVVVIIAVFAAVVGPRLLNQGDKARVVAAKQQIENFQLALGQYHLDTGGYPSTEQGLAGLRAQPSGVEQWHGPYLQKDVAADPWGTRMRTNSPATMATSRTSFAMARTDSRADRI